MAQATQLTKFKIFLLALKNFARGGIKLIPFFGDGIDQMIFGAVVEIAAIRQTEMIVASLEELKIIVQSSPPRAIQEASLPLRWIPHHRNPNFTGRVEILKRLRAELTSSKPAAVTQAIAGLGGIGKTQLAVEYAYCYATEYEVVWWVRSEEATSLSADYAALAGALGMDVKDETDQRVVIQAVNGWLNQHSGWLLVFDNAPGQDEVRPFLPQSKTGHVLVTSRNQVWGNTATPLRLDVFGRQESVDFLLNRTRQADEAAASALADALGDLPLALEQAAAYMEETNISLADYLNLFRQRQRELLARGAPPSEQYPDTVLTTWDISFEKLSDEVADLLRLIAFLAPDDIPKSLISEGAELLLQPLKAVVGDELKLNDALAALRRYSLVETSGDALSVHRLVQAVVRDRMAEDERKEWAGIAVNLVNAAFPYDQDDPATWNESARLLPHALACAGYAESLEANQEGIGRILNQAGSFLQTRGQFAEAKVAFGRALRIDEQAYGPEHPNVAIRVSNLGSVLQDLGDLAGARAHFERALRIFQKFLGDDHPNTRIARNNLRALEQSRG